MNIKITSKSSWPGFVKPTKTARLFFSKQETETLKKAKNIIEIAQSKVEQFLNIDIAEGFEDHFSSSYLIGTLLADSEDGLMIKEY